MRDTTARHKRNRGESSEIRRNATTGRVGLSAAINARRGAEVKHKGAMRQLADDGAVRQVCDNALGDLNAVEREDDGAVRQISRTRVLGRQNVGAALRATPLASDRGMRVATDPEGRTEGTWKEGGG